jgi:hypothetical protein
MRIRIPVLLAAAAIASACLEPLPTPNGRYGAITMTAYENGPDYVMRPEAAFYDKTDASYEPFPSDTCIVSPFSFGSGVISGNVILLDAGEFIQTSVSGRTDTLAQHPQLLVHYYRATATTGFPFTPGDTMTVAIPGATPGFPASGISVRTAEAFTHGAVGIPAADADLDLTWTAAPAAGAVMTFSLRYRNSFAADTLENEQVFCSFVDDGAAIVPSAYLDGWRTAQSDKRSTRAVRVRSRQINVDARTRLAIISTFAQPLNVITP